MSVTDQDMLSDVQSLLSEPLDGGATFPSGMWTPAEAAAVLAAAQSDLVAETAVVLKRRTAWPCVPHLLRQTLPDDILGIWRLVWVRASDNRHYVLYPSEMWELDLAIGASWRTTAGTPMYYTEADLPTRTVQIVPAPAVPGTLEFAYIAVPTVLDGSGVAADVPDETTVGLVWDAVSDLMTKEGRGKDTGRAAIAGERASLAREAVKLILRGWEL